MVNPDVYIAQGIKIVKNLISKEDFLTALKTCQELLRINPYNKKAQSLMQDIEGRIVEENIKKVDKDIDTTMPLWREGKFEELMRIYSKLYQYAPNYRRLHKLMEKLNDKFSAQQKQQRNDFIARALAAIRGLIKEKHYGDAIQASNELIDYAPLNEDAKLCLLETKKALVEQKLSENARITESADFERTLEFYESLLSIDPTNEKIKNLAAQAKTHLLGKNILAAQITLNESIARMKGLFDKADYEKVLQACEEIDRLDPGNITAQIFRKKAKNTMRSEANTLIVKKLQDAWAALEPEYRKNPSGFVRV